MMACDNQVVPNPKKMFGSGATTLTTESHKIKTPRICYKIRFLTLMEIHHNFNIKYIIYTYIHYKTGNFGEFSVQQQ